MARLTSAIIVALFVLSSRILGLARDLCLAYFFPRPITDAFAIAFRMPHFVRRLAGDASISLALVPWLQRQVRSTEVVLVNTVWIALIFAIIMGFGIPHMFANHLTPETRQLFPWCASYLFFTTLTVVIGSFLHANERYTEYGLAPLAFNALFLILLFWGSRELGAIVLVASAAQFLVVVWYFRNQLNFILSRVSFMPDWLTIRSLLLQIIASASSVGLFPLLAIATTVMAIDLGEGAPSWLLWADRIIELPVSLIAGPLVLTHRDDDSLTGPWGIMFLLLPASAGLYLLATPIVNVLFSHSQLTSYDLTSTGLCLGWLALSVLPQGYCRWLLAQGFRKHFDREILFTTLLLFLGHVVLGSFLKSQMGFVGLLISTVTILSLQLFYWLWRLHSAATFIKYSLFQLVPLGAMSWLLIYMRDHWQLLSPLALLSAITSAAAVYILLSCAIHYQKFAPQIDSVLRSLRR